MAYDVIRKRKIRGGRLRPFEWGGPARLLPAAQRRRDMERAQQDAKRKFPNLETKLDRIAKRIKEARMSGQRFAYKKPLFELYELAHGWHEEDRLDVRIGQVASLRGISVRVTANPFNVLVRAVLAENADRKTVSRWSVQLKKALDDDAAPSELNEYI
jgi:hypothetical protein